MTTGYDPATLFAEATQRFRCISWRVLAGIPQLILDPGSLDGQVVAANLYDLSEPCRLSQCDTFLSHSWHDPGEQKWAALTRWCEAFQQEHARPPHLWFDKVCIDQQHIAADLECLPIFVAGCNTMLVISGGSYTSRLCLRGDALTDAMIVKEEAGAELHVLSAGKPSHASLEAFA